MSMLFDSVIPSVAPVFLIILMGYLIGRKTSYDLKFVTDITMYFSLPALIFSSLAQKWDTPFQAKEFVVTGSGTAFIIFGSALLAVIYFRCTKHKDFEKLYSTIMFISSGNFVLSLNYFAFGYDGFLRGVFFQMVNTSLMFTLGVYLVGRETNIRKIFQIPFFYAATAGVLIWVWHIKLPDFILHGVDFTGKAALPMLLLLLGYSLKNIQIENASLAITGGLFRIFGGLFIATFFVLVLRSTGLVGNGEQEILTLKLLIFNGSMPAAVGTLLLAQKYDRRPELVASSVFASTVIGLTTIPAVLWSVNYFFG